MLQRLQRIASATILFTVALFLAMNWGWTHIDDLYVLPIPDQLCACECGPAPCKCMQALYDGPWIVCRKEVR